MGRRRGIIHSCAFRALDADQGTWATHESYRHGRTWCGKAKLFTEEERALRPSVASCPDCAKAMGKAKLAKLGERVRLEDATADIKALGHGFYFRSAYRFILDGVQRGWIVAESGWGGGWLLLAMAGPNDKGWRWNGGNVTPGRPSNSWDAKRVPAESLIQPIHYSARDAMACGAVRMAEAGKLLTTAEQLEAEERRKQEAAARDAERERERARLATEREQREALRLERLATWREALASLDGRADLTNLERAGLEAVKLLLPLD